MDTGRNRSGPDAAATTDRRKQVLLGAGLVVALGIAWVILSETIPRWWSQQVGDAVDGSLSTGFALGFCTGLIFTLLPLLVAWIGLRRRRPWKVALAWLAGAVVLAQPNLWTLAVVAGNSGSANAARSTMDVRAPWFSGGTLVGAVAAAVLFGGFLYYRYQRRHGRPRGGRHQA